MCSMEHVPADGTPAGPRAGDGPPQLCAPAPSSGAALPGLRSWGAYPRFGGHLWPGASAAIPASSTEGSEPLGESLCPLPATWNSWLSHWPPKGKDWPQGRKAGGRCGGAGSAVSRWPCGVTLAAPVAAGSPAEPGALRAAATHRRQNWLFAGIPPSLAIIIVSSPSKQNKTKNPKF